jgi:ParB family transcriptional regulator, chromosome partitioning protein
VPKKKRSGLPEQIGMRHDDHFVDLISSRSKGPQIRMIPLDRIDPNPQQARNELGDISELVSSVKTRGVLEPILVRPKRGRYEIIAGERRFMASQQANIDEIPSIILDVEDADAMEISLIENLQRKDLDVFEEADGLKALADIYGYNHTQISEKIGKARSTVTEIINLSRIPPDVRKICDENKINSRSTLLEISKQETKNQMLQLIQAIQERSLRREDTRDLSRKIKGADKPKVKRFVYNYKPEDDESCRVRIEFKRKDVRKEEIVALLESLLCRLKAEE